MNRVIGNVALVPRMCIRNASTTAVGRSGKPDMTNIKKKQIHFQMDNGVPIYLKGGPMDHVFYYATWLLTITGICLSAQAMYNMRKK